MSIQDTVNSLISNAEEWASFAREDAANAIAALADVDFPFPSTMSFTFNPLVEPNLEIPAQPTIIGLETAPVIASLAQVDKPDKPDVPTVELGALLSIVIPDIPVIDFPSLSIEAPSFSITAPENWDFVISDILITDDPMIQAALARLASNIENGGTGLSADIEADIWARDLERNEQQLADSTDKLTSMWAKKGWSLPDGLLAHSLSEIQKEYMNKQLDRSREIAIKQAELEQSNLFKSIELSVSLTSHLIDMLMRYEELGLRVQEDTAKFANEFIDLQIKTYNSLLEAYKATAQVHESIVRANIAKVELYKTQIEGQLAILSINDQTVKIYTEQLRATTMLIDRYKTEVDAMVAELGIEKAKVEVNKIQMDAWATKANAKIAVFNGEVDLFRSVSQQNIAVADLKGKLSEANLQASLKAAELSMKSLEVSESSSRAYAALRVQAAEGVARAAASLAAGAMAGVSTGASESYGESRPLAEGA